MLAYKHEHFVAQAIESVLKQQTDFPVELVIGEDGSPDRTLEVIRRYASTEKVEIRVRSNTPNIGMMRNFQATLQECRGQFVALLEGDDYWTDVEKLQRQVELMEGNRETAICFHPVDVLEQRVLVQDRRTRVVPECTTIYDLAQGNYMHTCSVLFRAGLFADFPPSFLAASAGDYFLHMLNARFGAIRKIDRKMAVYRVHEGGAWSEAPNMDLKILQYLECMIGNFPSDVDEILKDRHRKIAFASFVRRANEPGSVERLRQCLRYGEDHFADRISSAMSDIAAFKRSFVGRVVSRLT